MKHEFNPYDLNEIAEIGKSIKEWEQKKLRKSTHVPQTHQTKGILKPDDSRKKTPRAQIMPQS